MSDATTASPQPPSAFAPRHEPGASSSRSRSSAAEEAVAAVSGDVAQELGDFTATRRVIQLSALAIGIGIVSAYLAVALLGLITFFTNVFFAGRLSLAPISPSANRLGPWVILIPVVGSVIVGLIARFGSDRIRGHGIPEAIEAILINGSRVEPKLAILKPLSAAIAIGSGGPFGAEGPIIMTGGATGSLIAQFCHLSSAERKTLLVAGAAGGMAATFATPLAAVLLAVELLLFEWKPRSFIPVALASATAAGVRRYLLGPGPLFPVMMHVPALGPAGIAACALAGLAAGLLSFVMTKAVYASEDAFARLPMHWMWWPAIGGLCVGIGGWLFPPALGVGYDTIGALLQHDLAFQFLAGILLVKTAIWAIALGSGTSGGVLAPLLMVGGALGGVESRFLPAFGPGFWPLVSMGAILGGAMRLPLTGVVFAIELTHDVTMVLPLLIAVTIAHAFTVLTLRRSILTEKVARRGFHLSREYNVDPLEIIFVRETMRTHVVALPATATAADVRRLRTHPAPARRRERLYPIVDADRRLIGVVTRDDLEGWVERPPEPDRPVGEIARSTPMVAYPDEPLRAVVHRMADSGLTRFPVVERGPSRRLLGMISLADLLAGRRHSLDAERRRQRVLDFGLKFFSRERRTSTAE